MPSPAQLGSETNARYVLRVNPNGKKVDRFLLSHYHHDHGGGNLNHRQSRAVFRLNFQGFMSQHVIGAAVAAELKARGEEVFSVDLLGGDIALDLLASDAVERLGTAIKAKYEGVKGFVHCAGFDSAAPLGLVKTETVQMLVAIHAGFPIQFFGWLQKKVNHAPSTACVLISSLSVHEGAKTHVAYAAAKGAVEGILKPAAAELVSKGIRLNEVVLGVVETEMAHSWLDKLMPEQLKAITDGYPMGLGRPADVAKIVAFLLSADSSWITGQTLICDGGHCLC